MSNEQTLLKTLGSLALLGTVLLAVGLGVLLVIAKADDEKEEKGKTAAGGADGEEASGKPDPEKEVLIFKFREMFEYQPPPPVGDGRGGETGITPIVSKPANNKPIDLSELLVLSEDVTRSVAYLADGTTQVEQAVGWLVYDDRLHYFVLLRPFERVAHELMKNPGEELFVSFLDANGQRVVPQSAPEQIATQNLRVAMAKARRVPAGWVAYGELPMHGAPANRVKEPKVGWIFSGRLHARLQQLHRAHIVRDEGERDPFRVDFEAKGQ